MIRNFLASLRGRLLLMVLLAIIPAVGLTIHSGHERQRLTASRVQDEVLRLARLAASEHEQAIEGSRQLLVTLARLDAMWRQHPLACSALLRDLVKHYPVYADIGVIDADGHVLCSAVPSTGHVNVANLAHFRRAVESRDFALGDYQISHLSTTPTVNFAYPALDDVGRLRGVVFAALDFQWLHRFATEAKLPKDWVMAVFDREGTLLCRHPEPETWVGRKLPEAALVKAAVSHGAGTAEVTGLDGVQRMYGFAALHNTLGGGEVYVSVGVATEVAMAEVNRLLVHNLTEMGLVGVLALMAAGLGAHLLVLRSVRPVVRTAIRLGTGDLAARVEGVRSGEMGEVAVALNGMAERLQAAHAQLASDVAELERRQQELAVLREIDSKLLAGAPLPEILQAGVEGFVRLAEADRCILVRVRDEEGVVELEPAAIAAPDPDAIRQYYREPQPNLGAMRTEAAVATRAAVWSEDIAQDPEWEHLRESLLAQGVRAVLAVPLVVEGVVRAVLRIEYTEPHAFCEREIRTLQGLANQLGVALEQGRLREAAAERWRAEEANRLKTLFVANMSHELRTPLSIILGFAEILETGNTGALTEKQQRYVEHIRTSGLQLMALINDILDLSKVEAGRIELKRHPLRLGEVVEGAVALSQTQARKKRLEVEVRLDERLPLVMADPLRLRQILFNLLSNAVKFTPDGGAISVAAVRAEGDVVQLSVRDTGIGIKPGDLGRLFQEFVRIDTTLAWRAQGTGLGLALTKRLVELHGGRIWATSEGEGKGATFTVHLPIALEQG